MGSQGSRCAAMLAAIAVALAGCGAEPRPAPFRIPGQLAKPATPAVEPDPPVLQKKTPLDALNVYLDGFHFYSGNMQAQTAAHHYCGNVSADVIQCVIFDGSGEQAKIMGVEYIVGEAVFGTLPIEEKRLWHSHAHEVRSGQLVAPDLAPVAEHALMEKIARTYGKTWHTWQADQNPELPLGIPHLMMAFTQDGQIDDEMVAKRDRELGISGLNERDARADIDYPSIDPDADAWQKGQTLNLSISRKKK